MEKNLFENLNTFARTIKEGIDIQALAFRPLKDFRGYDLYVDGFFFTKGNYGEQVVVVAHTLDNVGIKVNMPSRAVEQFKNIQANKEMLDAVLTGHLMLTGIRETKTKNGTTTAYEYKTI